MLAVNGAYFVTAKMVGSRLLMFSNHDNFHDMSQSLAAITTQWLFAVGGAKCMSTVTLYA
jgi:hypothetical protein